jgi:hypothetical protein
MDIDTPSPLLSLFTQLHHCLSLSLHHRSIYLEFDLLLEVMSSCSHIQSLELDLHPHTITSRDRTIRVYVIVCIPLQVLMDIDPAADSFQHPSLHELFLGDSSIRDVEAVALIILFMLPHVGEVMYDKSDGGNSSAWGQVNRHLYYLRLSLDSS